MTRRLLCALCALLLFLPAAMAEESVIAPAYAVPEYVEWLLETARGELGTAESRSQTTKYGAWAGNPSAEWCAEFLCWCVSQTDSAHHVKMLNVLYPNYSGSNTGRDWYLAQGRYVSRRGVVTGWGTQWFRGQNALMKPNSYIPQPGDWMFLSNASTWDTTHVAMVEYCARDEKGNVRVHVIEGNSPFAEVKNAVVRSSYALDYWAILGYGTVNDVADLVMRFGCKGEKVKALQQDLLTAGIFPAGQKITGQYGAITERCIKSLQAQLDLPETGIADMATQLGLKRVITGTRIDDPENWVEQK